LKRGEFSGSDATITLGDGVDVASVQAALHALGVAEDAKA
jgi:hypothetical protein